MAKQLVRVLRRQHPDYHYLKKVFQHTRTLLAINATPPAKRLPVLLTDVEAGGVLQCDLAGAPTHARRHAQTAALHGHAQWGAFGDSDVP
jgi:hypothetical protein